MKTYLLQGVWGDLNQASLPTIYLTINLLSFPNSEMKYFCILCFYLSLHVDSLYSYLSLKLDSVCSYLWLHGLSLILLVIAGRTKVNSAILKQLKNLTMIIIMILYVELWRRLQLYSVSSDVEKEIQSLKYISKGLGFRHQTIKLTILSTNNKYVCT
jgi:hypothetical protein